MLLILKIKIMVVTYLTSSTSILLRIWGLLGGFRVYSTIGLFRVFIPEISLVNISSYMGILPRFDI